MYMRKGIHGTILVVLILTNILLPFNSYRTKAEFRTWIVDDDGPADFHSIKEAVNSAATGDKIIVRDGSYFEGNIRISKSLSIKAEGSVIIDGQGAQEVFYINAKDVALSGFSIRNEKGYGVTIRSSYSIVEENVIMNCTYGINLDVSGPNNIIKNNIIESCFIGIKLLYTSKCKLIKNSVRYSSYIGISLYGVHDSILEENFLVGCGLSLNRAHNNNISKNIIDSNDGAGIFLSWSSDENLITENLIQNNKLGIGLLYSYRNVIYHNNFINNKFSVQWDGWGGNTWDGGYPIGGNYWSDYIGEDEKSGPNQDQPGSDGIGDTPYFIEVYNKDRYPLMKPYNISFSPPSGYILHVQSYPITGIEISYYGDYSGTGTTNFDIGPKSSPFTVTLTAPLTYQDYTFDHWELDGINQGYGATLMVKIDDEKKERIAVARYIATQIEEVLLNFSVVYENEFYYISLAVPLSNYNTAIMEFPNVYYTWFAHIDTQLLKSAYYLYRYTLDPNQYPILDVSVQVDGQRLVDENVKIEILDGLLQYAYELFMFAFPSRLEEYVWCEKQWLKSHEDLTFWVTVSDKATQILDWLTALGPIVDTVGRALGYTEQSKHVEALVKLFLSIIKGQNYLIETYGKKDADAIICILKDLNVISSDDYNGAEVYEKFQQDPDFAVTVLEKIYKDVFKSTIGPTERSLIKSFIAELKNAVISGFAVGTAVGLHAYFIHGAKWSTALKIGLSKAFTALLEKIVAPLTIATIVHRGYNLPMAQSLHDAWEDMKVISQIYSDLKRYGEKIAKPVNNQFNLTNAKLLACFLGVRCIIEFDYYIHCYTHTMGQYLNPKRLQEADGLKRFAESLLSEAKGWADMLKKIRGYAEAIVNKGDPEGSSFDFTFQPPKNVFPSTPHHPQGLILIANSTTNLIMKCGNYHFIVQNREWFTNFTNAIYVDDPYDNIYLIIFNPPEGKYDVEAQNFASLTLVKFALSTEGVILSRVGEGMTTMSFEVSSSGEIKTVVPSWWVQHHLWIIAGVIGTATILTVSVALIKRRKKHMAQLSENAIKPMNHRK
ncbi:MAG: NosD domain-containing protein [Nitrososphaerota archaeon]